MLHNLFSLDSRCFSGSHPEAFPFCRCKGNAVFCPIQNFLPTFCRSVVDTMGYFGQWGKKAPISVRNRGLKGRLYAENWLTGISWHPAMAAYEAFQPAHAHAYIYSN